MYHDVLKEGNGDHKFLRCPDLWDNNFDYLRSGIAYDKIELECAENIKAKPNGND